MRIISLLIFLVCIPLTSFGSVVTSSSIKKNNPSNHVLVQKNPNHIQDPVVAREVKETVIPADYFAITTYRPNYVLPFYLTGSPYTSVYQGQTPSGEQLKKAEFKYQISLKVPIWKNIRNSCSSLYLGYTQLSYWQLYNKRPFFRETDYEPEIFLTNLIDYHMWRDIKLDFINFGADHQSNGFGNDLERSWNRIYGEVILSKNNWMLTIKPWWIINDSSKNRYNPDIGSYMGYTQFLLSYKLQRSLITLRAYNLFQRGFSRPSAELSMSFPITNYIKGYAQFFTGYGQSLIEYNHHTNSVGVGIALSDWV